MFFVILFLFIITLLFGLISSAIRLVKNKTILNLATFLFWFFCAACLLILSLNVEPLGI